MRFVVWLAIILLSATLGASPALAQNTATLTTSGLNWTNSAAWTTAPTAGLFPNNGSPNLGDVWNVTIGSSGAVTLNQAIVINDLNWDFGTLSGANSLTLNGAGSAWTSDTAKRLSGKFFTEKMWVAAPRFRKSFI